MVSTTALAGAVCVSVIFAALALALCVFCVCQGYIRFTLSANPPYHGADSSVLWKFLAAGCGCFCILGAAGGLLTWLVLCDGSHLCATLP